MRLHCVSLVMAAMAFVGCAPKATFDLTIMNQTNGPVTVGLVKDGPPPEPAWAAPEDQALETRLEAMPPWGHVIPPGRTMDSPPIIGTFPQGTVAYLRVYAGEHSNVQLLAISRSSPDRTEALLFPGHSNIVVRTDEAGHLRAERAGEQRR